MKITNKRPLKVFLCHAHADRDPVRGLYIRLTKDGVDAWLDKEKLLPGQDWEFEIRKAVHEADVVVVCLSKQFNQAGFRQKEVRLALDTAMEKPEGEIFIIPARLEECDNLESLRKWHWVDLFEEGGYQMLMRALRARADTIGTTLQMKKNKLPKLDESKERQQELEIKKLESQAIQYELKGDFWNAQKSYYKIKRIDPSFPRIDVKIGELEKEIRPAPSFSFRSAIVAIVGIFIFVVTVWGSSRSMSLASANNTAIAATQIALAASTSNAVTQLAFAASTSSAETQIALVSSTSNAATQLVRATDTPSLSGCEAKTRNSTRLFPQPGWTSQPAISIPEGKTVTVDGRVRDQAWVHTKMDDKSGFMRKDDLIFLDANCAPSIADLHFLAGWLQPGWRVLVDDTTFEGQTSWTTDNAQPLPTTSTSNESALRVVADIPGSVFSTEVLRRDQVSAFDLHTYFIVQRLNEGSYFAVRFYEEDGSLYEVRFSPKECIYSIYENKSEIFESVFSESVCAEHYFAINLSVDVNHNLILVVNGMESTSMIHINDLKEGGIDFSIYNLSADFNYIVVMAPR